MTETPASQAKTELVLPGLHAGRGNPTDPYNPGNNREHAGMAFFHDRFDPGLSKNWVECIVSTLAASYIAVTRWGMTNIKKRLEKRITTNYDPCSVQYQDMDDERTTSINYCCPNAGPGARPLETLTLSTASADGGNNWAHMEHGA